MENAYSLSLPPAARTPGATVFNLDFTGEGSDYDKKDAATYTEKIFSSADNQFFTTKNLGILSEQIAALGGLAFPYLEQKSVEQATDFGTLSNAMNTVLEEIEQGNINNPLTGGMWQDFMQGLRSNNGRYTIVKNTRKDVYDKDGNLVPGKITKVDRKQVQVIGGNGS